MPVTANVKKIESYEVSEYSGQGKYCADLTSSKPHVAPPRAVSFGQHRRAADGVFFPHGLPYPRASESAISPMFFGEMAL
jgi:hypothetical protein